MASKRLLEDPPPVSSFSDEVEDGEEEEQGEKDSLPIKKSAFTAPTPSKLEFGSDTDSDSNSTQSPSLSAYIIKPIASNPPVKSHTKKSASTKRMAESDSVTNDGSKKKRVAIGGDCKGESSGNKGKKAKQSGKAAGGGGGGCVALGLASQRLGECWKKAKRVKEENGGGKKLSAKAVKREPDVDDHVKVKEFRVKKPKLEAKEEVKAEIEKVKVKDKKPKLEVKEEVKAEIEKMQAKAKEPKLEVKEELKAEIESEMKEEKVSSSGRKNSRIIRKKESEEELRKLRIMEMQLNLRRLELIGEHMKLILDAYRSQS